VYLKILDGKNKEMEEEKELQERKKKICAGKLPVFYVANHKLPERGY